MVFAPYFASSAGLRRQTAGRAWLLRVDENTLLVPNRAFGKSST